MDSIKLNSIVTLVDRSGLGMVVSHERWQIVGMDGDIYTVGLLRKDGGISKKRPMRKIKREDIREIFEPEGAAEHVEPIPVPIMREAPTRKGGRTVKVDRKRIPAWMANVPTALEPYITESVSLAELIDHAQHLMKEVEPEQADELLTYIKKNRRHVRKRGFEW